MRTESSLEKRLGTIEEALANVKELWNFHKHVPCGCQITRQCHVCRVLEKLWSNLELTVLKEKQILFENLVMDPVWAEKPRSHSEAPAPGGASAPEGPRRR